jgi:MFS transporter, DHA1 family, multidrug resistance protein
VSVLLKYRALLIYIAAASTFAGLSARNFLVPLYAHGLGASRFSVGALFAVSTLAGAFLAIPSGVLVDRLGVRTLLWSSVAVSAVSQLATAATSSIPVLFVWQIVGGLAGGALNTVLFSAVTESVVGGRLGRAMGWLTFSFQAGFFIGPTIAGVLLTWLDLRADIAVTTVVLLFAIPGSVAASNAKQSGAGSSLVGPLKALFAQPSFSPLIVGLVAVTLMWGTVSAFLPIFGKEGLGLPGSQVGYLIALQAVANGAARIPAGSIVDRARRRWPLVFLGVMVWSAGGILLGHVTGFLAPAAVLLVATPFMALAFVAIGAVFGNLSAASTRGVTMGFYTTVLFFGLAAGPLAFGPIVQDFGYAAGFTACAAVAIVLALAMAAMQSETLRRSIRRGSAGGSETRAEAASRR